MQVKYMEEFYGDDLEPTGQEAKAYSTKNKKRQANKSMFSFIFVSPFITSAAVAIGHHILPHVGLASLAAGGGSLAVAATSVLASGGILCFPAAVMYVLINEKVENKLARNFLNIMLLVAYAVGNFLLAAELFGVNALPLFMQFAGGGLTAMAAAAAIIVVIVVVAEIVRKICPPSSSTYGQGTFGESKNSSVVDPMGSITTSFDMR